MSALFEGMFKSSAAPVLTSVLGDTVSTWSVENERVTAIQLSNGQSYSALFHEHASEKREHNGTFTNAIKGVLWLPVTSKPQQQMTWRIVRADGTSLDVTTVSHGERSGGYLAVQVEQVTVSKFAGALR